MQGISAHVLDRTEVFDRFERGDSCSHHSSLITLSTGATICYAMYDCCDIHVCRVVLSKQSSFNLPN